MKDSQKGFGPEWIREAVERRSGEIVSWTRRLVQFASENRPPNGNEAYAQSFLEEQCRSARLSCDVFAPDAVPGIEGHPSWLPGREYGNGRRNVVACWKGTGSGRSILFSGHVDVAPFEPDSWKECRPFDPVLRGNRLYGRGSADMKGGLASAFWALKILDELGFEPEGDILFESLVDEEFAGGNGTLAARLRGHNADLAVVPEPTSMDICPACFGAFLGDLTIRGKAGMPYMGTSIPNPIHGAARAVKLFGFWERMWRSQNDHPLFREHGKELNVLVWQLETARPGELTQMGTPLECRAAWIVWCHPGMTEQAFYERFRAFWSEHAAKDKALLPFELELERRYHFVKPWETPADNPAVQAVREAFLPYGSPRVSGAPFSCDLGIYGEVGRMPAVLLGPRGDNLHAPDEWVDMDDVVRLAMVFANLAAAWCSSGTTAGGRRIGGADMDSAD